MNNVIFGSGIVGLFAKSIFPTWKVIPFGRSRFFTFNPALDDNFIIRGEGIDEAIRDISKQPTRTHLYRRAFDVGGQLFGRFDKGLYDDWTMKIFGSKTPSQTLPYFNNQLDLHIYDIRTNQLYEQLLGRHLTDLKEEYAKGVVTEVGDHYFVRGGVKEEFDNVISTIPLPAMNTLMGLQQELPAKHVHLLHVHTDSLDFEGYNQTLVTDSKFAFYKVTNIAPERYLFYCHEEIPHPGPYLMPLLKNFDILDGTSIVNYLAMGGIPKLDHLEKKGVFSVGSYAQWDWCMDVGSCLLRLVRYAQRGFKPFKKEIIP